jgi:hypothetical protein
MSVKALRQIVRIVLLAAGGLVGLAAIAIWKPYIEVTEVRATAEPQAVQVTWYLGCEEDYYEDDDKQRYLPQLPVGGEPPAVGPAMTPGTRFLLVGHSYAALHRNLFTGRIDRRRSERFDVIEWHVVPPYFLWNGEKQIESSEPVGWKSEKVPAQFIAQLDRRRKEC